MRNQAANAVPGAGGPMYCPKCGANVADGAAFCGACGQPMAGAAAVPPNVNVSPAYAAPQASPTWQAPAAAPNVAYAGFWLRFVAVIIDVIIIYCVRGLILLPFGISLGMHGMFRGRHVQTPEELLPVIALVVRVTIITAIIQWLYFSLMESSAWQATLGKKALGLTVTDLEGRRISFGRATGRWFAKILSGVILFIGYMMAGFTEKKQALHDMIAGTLVLRKL